MKIDTPIPVVTNKQKVTCIDDILSEEDDDEEEDEKEDEEGNVYMKKELVSQNNKPARGIIGDTKMSVSSMASEMAKERERSDKKQNKHRIITE